MPAGSRAWHRKKGATGEGKGQTHAIKLVSFALDHYYRLSHK